MALASSSRGHVHGPPFLSTSTLTYLWRFVPPLPLRPCGPPCLCSTKASLALRVEALTPSLSINTVVIMSLGLYLKTKRIDSHLLLTGYSNAPRYVLFEFRMKKLYKVQSLLVDDPNLICETKIYGNLMLRWCIHVVHSSSTASLQV